MSGFVMNSPADSLVDYATNNREHMMGRKLEYSQPEWDAFARGELLAEKGRSFKTPPGLPAAEQKAFREGYDTRCEDIRNRSVVADIKKMVSPLAIKRLFRSLAHHH